jgi:hypothetical protein
MMDIVWEIRKVSYRALKATGRKICARRLLLHKKIPKFIYKKEVNVQNINSILLELRYILKNPRVTAMSE